MCQYALRFDFRIPQTYAVQCYTFILGVAILKAVVFYLMRGHREGWRFLRTRDIRFTVCYAAVNAVILLLSDFLPSSSRIPRGVIAVDFLLSIGFLSAIRYLMQQIALGGSSYAHDAPRNAARQAVVYGMTKSCDAFIRESEGNPQSTYTLHAIFRR